MSQYFEAYRKLGDPDDRFDLEYWQAQGPEAIFEAAMEMALEAYQLKNGDAERPQFQRTIEHYGKF